MVQLVMDDDEHLRVEGGAVKPGDVVPVVKDGQLVSYAQLGQSDDDEITVDFLPESDWPVEGQGE